MLFKKYCCHSLNVLLVQTTILLLLSLLGQQNWLHDLWCLCQITKLYIA